jgi:hypothetical protein
MRLSGERLALVALVLVLASASAGASTGRPRVALSASPAHVQLAGSARTMVRVRNAGGERAVLDMSLAGFALDLRGRPRIVAQARSPRSAAAWLGVRPRALALAPGSTGEVTIASHVPAGVEPGDHDALVLLTTRRRVEGGIAVRMRMGIVVVVRAPGTVVRHVELGRLRVARSGRMRLLELGMRNRGNVTESLARGAATLSLFRNERRIARLQAEPRNLRPRSTGVLRFLYRGPARGPATARVEVEPAASGRLLRGRFRVRL